ncbi:MAG: aldo/keto reductase [Rikenellaceae bacterium]|jgi:alcohol dehydrogenase (NADP+)|nr:aldo/keto reductase [Rikenellaceae bacterium]
MEYYICENGDRMPLLGLGTWQSEPEKLYEAVLTAVRAGYRHIDCAYVYQNEEAVGRALKYLIDNGEVRREELWITSKLWNSFHRREQVIPALRHTLASLQLDYLDMYLVHWPLVFCEGVMFPQSVADLVSLSEIPIAQTWSGMEEAHREKLTRHIGVSNFSIKKLKELLATCAVRPENNQIELNPYLQQPALVDYCLAENIAVTAFSPLGKGDQAFKDGLNLYRDPVIVRTAQEQHATPAQVLLRWAIQKGIAVIPKSVTPSRIRENFEAVNLVLTTDQMAAIDRLDRHHRMSGGWNYGGEFTLANLWDE